MEEVIAYLVINVNAPKPPVYLGPDLGLASSELASVEREERGETFRLLEITKVRTGSDGRTVIRSRVITVAGDDSR
ncbi:hypothetical protein [Dactylosporangium sp. CS-033363]|uniref:hypothetical protein n=1 Tax=Dactylosporangium sp. CS-033363 TaxID=3239935 RepID=UPI003D8AAAC8